MSKTLTKLDLAKQLTEGAKGPYLWMTQKNAVDIIETVMDLITCHIQNGGDAVTIRGFGTFKRRKRCAFLGTNPSSGEPIEIPERLSLTFKPSAEVIRRINI